MKKFLVAMGLAAFAFVGCGDDSSSDASSESNNDEPVSSSEIQAESSSSGSEAGSEYDASSNTLKDLRDGKIYRTVTIGSQVWMAENLNYETPDSYCYNDSSKYCDKLGRLYKWLGEDSSGTWFDNGDYQRVCPSGWHLPTKAEFETLIKMVGGDSVASKKLKSTSGWFDGGNGTDDYAFTAYPSGYRGETGGFYYEDSYAYFWSSTEYDRGSFYVMVLNYNDDIATFWDSNKSMSYSVRCVKD